MGADQEEEQEQETSCCTSAVVDDGAARLAGDGRLRPIFLPRKNKIAGLSIS